jgi:LmbE family N-acetylglucosaminyl deacetylase
MNSHVSRSRAVASALALLLATLLLMAVSAGRAGAAEPSCTGRTLATAAHEDDTLLFMSPRLQSELDSGRCLRTVFVTAGDAGEPASYYEGREAGVEAAYAEMAGVANSWTTGSVTSDGHALRLQTLTADPRVSILFMRLPDGGNGEGYARYGNQSIVKLWCSANACSGGGATETEIEADDKSTKYTYQGLVDTLAGLIDEFGPSQIWTQDYEEEIHGTDHPDHVITGRFTRSAAALDPEPHRLIAVWDYKTETMPVNVTGQALTKKQQAYYTYGAHDPLSCHSAAECETGPFAQYGAWLKREYVHAEQTKGVVADAGYGQTVSANQKVTLDGSASSDEANLALSYDWVQTGGPSVDLSDPHVYDPSFTMLAHPTLLTFRLTVEVGGVTSAPDHVQVRVPSSDPTPTAVVAAGASVESESTVQMNGSESWDPNSLPLAYEWTQTAGPKVTLTNATAARPEFVSPLGPASLSFSLVVSNGTEQSEAVPVTYEVKGVAPTLFGPTSSEFRVGTSVALALQAKGSPTPQLRLIGELPAGLTFVDDGDGTATISGSPAASVTAPGTSRTFALTIKATNEVGEASRGLTLTVVDPPAESSPQPPTPPASQPQGSEPVFSTPDVAYGFVGRMLDLPIEATGAPQPAISLSGELPAGLELRVDGSGQVRLVGRPKVRGVHRVTLYAANSAGTAGQQLSLVLEPLPELSRRALALHTGVAAGGSVRIAGPRIESAQCLGGLPKGLRCRVQGRRVSLTGTPAASSAGIYKLRLKIAARAGTVELPLTLRIRS